jgi:hypothetical protein
MQNSSLFINIIYRLVLKEGPVNKRAYIGITKHLHFLDKGKSLNRLLSNLIYFMWFLAKLIILDGLYIIGNGAVWFGTPPFSRGAETAEQSLDLKVNKDHSLIRGFQIPVYIFWNWHSSFKIYTKMLNLPWK